MSPEGQAFLTALRPFARRLRALAIADAVLGASAFGALGVVLVISNLEAFIGKEALLKCHPPGAVMGVAVALQPDGACHGGLPAVWVDEPG